VNPQPVPRRLEPPAHYDATRRATWTDAVSRLMDYSTDTGGVFRADPHLLDVYVESVASHAQASQILAQTNVMITRGDRAIENPALGIQRRTAADMTKAAKALGLHRTPMVTPSVLPERPDPMGGARWCEQHDRAECVHHRVRCEHERGSPVPAEGCCHQRAVKGTASCYLHAGKALAEVKADGLANMARIYTGEAVEIDPASALLWELGHSAALVGELRAEVARIASEPGPDGERGSGLFWGVTLERERDGVTERELRAVPNVILKALDLERDHLIKTAAAAHTAGAQVAAIDAARAASASLYSLLSAIFAGLELSPRQRDELIPKVVPAAIRAWNPEEEPAADRALP
jgi:Phage terminase, small subunit